jgi:hypothetical protein
VVEQIETVGDFIRCIEKSMRGKRAEPGAADDRGRDTGLRG